MLVQDDEMYMISPVPERLLSSKRTTHKHGAHIIYKRSSLPDSHPISDLACGFKGKCLVMRELKSSLNNFYGYDFVDETC